MRFKRALVVGKPVHGDDNVLEFEEAACQNAWPISRHEKVSDALVALELDASETLVFFATQGMSAPWDPLESLAATKASILVYAESRHDSTDLAIQCSQHAADYLVALQTQEGMVHGRVKALTRDRPLYAPIRLKTLNGKLLQPLQVNSKVFIASSFAEKPRTDLEDAVDPALIKLKLRPVWGDTEYRSCMSIFEKITECVVPASLLIADIREDEGDDRPQHNPNVYFEAGLACGCGIPVVFVRPRKRPWRELPVDIKGLEILEYDSPINLALKLYHGLKECIAP
jgi:hypothetical protein